MYFKLFDIIIGTSCFLLAIFSFFLIHKGRKNISNIILFVFFVVQFIVISNYLLVSVFENIRGLFLQIVYVYYPFIFLWGPLLFFYVKSQVSHPFKFRFIDIIHLIPFVLATIFIVFYYYVSDNETKWQIVKNGLIYKYLYYLRLPYYIQLFTYNLAAIFLIIKYQRNLKDYCSFIEKRNLVWLKFVLYGYIIACLISFSINFIDVPYIIKMIISFGPFLIFFNILFYKALIEPYVIIMPDEKPKYSNSNLDKTDIRAYSKTIEQFFITNKPYLNPTLTLSDLARDMGIPEKSISQVINQQWNQNFFAFINSYRIEEAKIKINNFNPTIDTLLGIAFDSGFNSKSSFYDIFKKQTGLTPTEYRKSQN